mgnify:CR=1 FL=1
MILDKKFLASSKYGKQGFHQKQVAGHQINPVRAKRGKKIKYPRPHELTEAELKEAYPGQFRNESNALAPKHYTKGRKQGGPVKLLTGALLTKGIKLAYKGVKKHVPTVKGKLHSKKVTIPGGEKVKVGTLRKLALTEVLRARVQKLAKIAVKNNLKARSLLRSKMTPWTPGKGTPIAYKGKKVATAMLKKNQYKNIHRYTAKETGKKVSKLEKDFNKLGTYQAKLESTFRTKHATGGLIIGKNIDRNLL